MSDTCLHIKRSRYLKPKSTRRQEKRELNLVSRLPLLFLPICPSLSAPLNLRLIVCLVVVRLRGRNRRMGREKWRRKRRKGNLVDIGQRGRNVEYGREGDHYSLPFRKRRLLARERGSRESEWRRRDGRERRRALRGEACQRACLRSLRVTR